MPKRKKLAKKELDLYKKILLELRAKISGNIQHLEKETLNTSQKDASGDLSGYSFHMADMATDNFDREFTLGLASTEQKILNDIDVALKKIETGDYGICEKYGTPIPKKRLMAMPYAKFSKKAKEEEEKERRLP